MTDVSLSVHTASATRAAFERYEHKSTQLTGPLYTVTSNNNEDRCILTLSPLDVSCSPTHRKIVKTFLFKDRKNSTTMYVRYMDHRDVLGTPATDGDTVLRRKFRNRRVTVEFRTSPGRPCTRRSRPHNGSLQSLRAGATRQRRKIGHLKRHALCRWKKRNRGA
jgi:hypothetical protein